MSENQPAFTPDLSDRRFQELAPGVYTERLAPSTQISWDPATESGNVVFESYDYLLDASGHPVRNLQRREGTVVTLESLITALVFAGPEQVIAPGSVIDPVSGVDISHLSGAGLAMAVKAIFKNAYNAQTPANPPL